MFQFLKHLSLSLLFLAGLTPTTQAQGLQLFKNNAATTLAAAISASQTSITVSSAIAFPTPSAGQFFFVTLSPSQTPETFWEIVCVTAVSGNTFTLGPDPITLTGTGRGMDNTTALAWPAGTNVSMRPIAQSLRDLSSDNLGVTGSVGQTQHAINYEVNVMKFGAACNGTTDDTTAVQNAINYCLTNVGTLINGMEVIPILKVPGPCLITSVVNIDRADTGRWSMFRVIGEGNSGGFVTNVSGLVMFSSTLAGGSGTRSNLISFERIHFNGNGSVGVSEQLVINPTKFDRIFFDNCWFGNIGLGYSASSYLQSLYVRKCRIQGMYTGQWLQATDFDDVEISQCLFEGNTQIGSLITSTGTAYAFRFCNNLVESNSEGVLTLNNANGVEITGNYAESNGISGSGQQYPFLYCTYSNAINIEGNYVYTGTGQVGRYEFQILTPNGLHGSGNRVQAYPGVGNAYMYSFTNPGTNVDVGTSDTVTGPGALLNNTALITKDHYGIQSYPSVVTGAIEFMGYYNGRILVTDPSYTATNGGTAYTHARFTINFQGYDTAAMIRVTCTSNEAGVGQGNQMTEWAVTGNGSTTLTLTSVTTTSGASYTPVTAAVSTNTVVLTYNAPTTTNGNQINFNCTVEIQSAAGTTSPLIPTVTLS